jgi:membrane dipeptidase
MMFIVDAHEDIAWNALTFGRNFTQSALAIRAGEADKPRPCGDTMLGRAEWLVGHVGIVFGTLFVTPERRKWGKWDSLCYRDVRHAYQLAGAQLDYYHRLADENEWAVLIGDGTTLDEVVATWEEGKELADRRVGFVPLMEGAEPILEHAQAEEWYARGLRIVGLAWARTRYAGSSSEPGPLTPEGEELLATMAGLGMILDLSHSAEEACYQSLERYEGVVIASHSNPRRFTPSPRGLSDEMIAMLAERGGVVGIVLYNPFLKPGWRKSDGKALVTLSDVADAIDHVCQVVGSSAHVGIGSDLDGGFGVDEAPDEVDTVADLLKIGDLLAERGYAPEHIADVMHGNWLRILREAL